MGNAPELGLQQVHGEAIQNAKKPFSGRVSALDPGERAYSIFQPSTWWGGGWLPLCKDHTPPLRL